MRSIQQQCQEAVINDSTLHQYYKLIEYYISISKIKHIESWGGFKIIYDDFSTDHIKRLQVKVDRRIKDIIHSYGLSENILTSRTPENIGD